MQNKFDVNEWFVENSNGENISNNGSERLETNTAKATENPAELESYEDATKRTVLLNNEKASAASNTNSKKKLGKGALIAIVISSLLAIIIAIVAVVLSIGNDNDNYYDYDKYDNDYVTEEDFISILQDDLIYDEKFSDTYPVAITSSNGEIAWIEYNSAFTKYRIFKVESIGEHCVRLYKNSKFKDFYDIDYYPERYELTNEEYFETVDFENLLYGYDHVFEIYSDGYIDHVILYDSDYIVDGNWDDYCDYNGHIIE